MSGAQGDGEGPTAAVAGKRLSIILPSFNDPRIADAIASVRAFDDIDTVRLVVIDGGSNEATLAAIRPYLRDDDIFICEADRGIFDALNKGLTQCTTPYIGWLGSDDLFSGQVRASEVVAGLEHADLFVTDLVIFNEDRIRRINHALPCRLGLVKFGLHNPHYATFGHANLLKSERFELDLLGSDIKYFLKIFAKSKRVATRPVVGVLMREGGYSNSSRGKILKVNLQLFGVYAAETNMVVAMIAIAAKMSYKLLTLWYYRLFKTSVQGLIRN